MSESTNFCCSTCGALATLPWGKGAWCLHQHSNFQPRPPSHEDSDWTRMDIVVSVETEPVPDGPWWVTEQRNPYSWFEDGDPEKFPGEDKRSFRVVDGPFETFVQAIIAARTMPTQPGVPPHGHSFSVLPDDLVPETMR